MAKTLLSLSDKAYDYILDLILNKKIVAGEKIQEQRLADELSMSRSPVRDALKRLQADGAVDIHQNRFAQVTDYRGNDEEIRNIGTLRINLEYLSIKLAMLYGRQSDFLELKGMALACQEAFLQGDLLKGSQLDLLFHTEISRLSDNHLLLDFQRSLSLRARMIMLQVPDAVILKEEHILEHLQIADALIDRNEDLALQIMFHHLSNFYHFKEIFPADWCVSFYPEMHMDPQLFMKTRGETPSTADRGPRKNQAGSHEKKGQGQEPSLLPYKTLVK